MKGPDRQVRAFKNACRHRGTRLVGDGACSRKSIVCPYHAWTYDLTGRVMHVPHADGFSGRERARDALVSLETTVRHGLVWVGSGLDALLAPIDSELRAASPDLPLFRRSERVVQGNWKLIIDAFLEVYHVKPLHHASISRFFMDSHFDAEQAGLHIRAVTARRPLHEVAADALDASTNLRTLVTPSYLVFPNTVLVLNPDYLSVMTMTPLAVGATRFVHWLFVDHVARDAAEAEHWEKSWKLIDEGVFGREDIGAVESAQRGLATGANETLLIGRHEFPILWFHRELAALLE
jgi:phenylpropionate dioxygenase-like ring-hydroxylating dioxygenase large terminal subunit